ncbi:hypothetical protein R1sor_008022 [Riccia sorocarpa]|uniref:Uncharacterized protein n=1 Tax=Riccia sorocarpa TaxID=122646 RepID=A0ABD3HUC4_9MARC
MGQSGPRGTWRGHSWRGGSSFLLVNVMTRHRALEADIAEQMGRMTAEELNPETLRVTWELLQRYDASVQSLSGICTTAHQLVTKNYQNRSYDPVELEGVDLQMIVMRGNKAMWPLGKHEE